MLLRFASPGLWDNPSEAKLPGGGAQAQRKSSVQLFAVVFIGLLIAVWAAQAPQLSLPPSLLPCHCEAEE